MRIDVDLQALAPGGLSAAVKLQCTPAEASSCQDSDILVVASGLARDGETQLDATALLARYQRLGEAMAGGLRGSYAIAIVDAQRRHVALFNDRMAMHGWCHARQGSRLRISDRADTIADGAAVDPQAIFTYLFNHVIPAPDTVWRGVRRLPPGHRLIATVDDTRIQAHWQPVFTEPSAPDFEALKAEFRALVRAAVAREAGRHAKGGLGTFLSGGTDSSTVAGMLRKVTGGTVHAYSIGFDAEGYDEMEYARIAARRFGLEHHEHYLTPEEVATGMPAVAAHYDQPFGNSSAVAAFHCARVACGDGRTALLAGDGGDELFGGNTRYAKQSLFALYQRIPSPLRIALLEPMLDNRVVERVPGLSKAASYVHQARVPMPDRLQMYNLLLRLGLSNVLTPAFLAQVDPLHNVKAQRTEYARSENTHLINRMLAFDWKYTLADNDLPKVLGTAKLAGIQTAFPLLADELVDFSLSLPSHYKLNGQKLRWFFKESLSDFLPQEILIKKKQGFGLPFGLWVLRHAQLSKLGDEALASFATRSIIDPRFILSLRRDLLQAHPSYYGELVWIICMLEFWLREYAPKFSIPR